MNPLLRRNIALTVVVMSLTCVKCWNLMSNKTFGSAWQFRSAVKNSVYDAGRGGGPLAEFFFSVTVIIFAPSSACCAMLIWAIAGESKLGTANGVTT